MRMPLTLESRQGSVHSYPLRAAGTNIPEVDLPQTLPVVPPGVKSCNDPPLGIIERPRECPSWQPPFTLFPALDSWRAATNSGAPCPT